MKVLIADDDLVFVHLLIPRLTREGFQIVVASDAIQTMTVARHASPRIVLLEVKMPGGNGLELLKRFKNSTKTDLISIIVVSALTDPDLPQKAMELGAAAFFAKPVDLDALCDALRRIAGLPHPGPAKVV